MLVVLELSSPLPWLALNNLVPRLAAVVAPHRAILVLRLRLGLGLGASFGVVVKVRII